MFDQVQTDSHKATLLQNLYDERYMNVQVTLDEATYDNPYLAMLKKQAALVSAVRQLCSLLGVHGVTDTNTWIHQNVFEREDVKKVTGDCMKLMKQTSRAKSGESRAGRADVQRVLKAFAGVDLVRKRVQVNAARFYVHHIVTWPFIQAVDVIRGLHRA